MKIIDILNDLSKGKTYKFKYDDDIYKYNKSKRMYEGVFLNLDAYHLELILNDEVEVIEENKEIEEKLDWEEIIGSVGKPLWDNKKKIWRVLDSYYREGNSFKISFSDTNNLECFENQELYFTEREEK